jgi:diacylglycerol kinase (ATP)
MNPNKDGLEPGFSLRARLRGFRHAWNGIAFLLRTQPNAWIHAGVTLAVCAAGFGLHISAADWRWLVAAITLVWAAEALNTAIEFVCDAVSPEYHPAVKNAKDIAAGAVLLCALGAAILGALTLAQYI